MPAGNNVVAEIMVGMIREEQKDVGFSKHNIHKQVSRTIISELFLQGRFVQLVALAVAAVSKPTSRSRRGMCLLDRVSKLVAQGRLAAACNALQERELARPSADVLQQIQAKFPARKEDLPNPPSDEPLPGPAAFTADEVQDIALKLPRHTGAGPSGAPMTLWSHAFREAARSPDDTRYISAFTWFCNQVFSGADWIGDYLREVRLVAIKQDSGRYRPIQIAETLDRFLGKVLLSKHIDALRTYFGDLQAVVAPAGADKIIHFVRSAMALSDTSLLMVDFANAFNEISRASIRRQLQQHFPRLLPYFDLRYRDATTVRFGDNSFECDEGVRQGDPWGAVFFALALHPILQTMQAKYVESVIIRAFADDVNTVATTTNVDWHAFLADLIEEAHTAGLKVRISKSAAYSRTSHIRHIISPAQRENIAALPVVDPGCELALIPPESGVVVLGAPVGHDAFVEEKCIALVNEIKEEMALLKKIDQLPQQYFLLLHRCFNTRGLHLARWVPPELLAAAAKRHDANVDYYWALSTPGITRDLDADTLLPLPLRWARLPSRYGGSGLTSMLDIRHPAYLSSVARAWNSFGQLQTPLRDHLLPTLTTSIAHLVDCLALETHPAEDFPNTLAESSQLTRIDSFERAFKCSLDTADTASILSSPLFTNFATELGQSTSAQRSLTAIKNSHSYDQLLSDFYQPNMSTEQATRAARFLSGSCKDAVAWTSCIPSDPQFIIPPEEYRWLLSHHFLLPIPDRPIIGDRCTDPRHPLDPLGHHLFNCVSHRTVPHDNTRDRFHMFCTQAGLKPTTEPANLLRNQETGAISERRPDISVGGLDPQGRLLLLDVTTTDPGCATSLNNGHAATQRGGAAAAAERRKQVAYADWINPAVQSFMPLAFEMSGRWGSLSSKFFDLVKRTAVERRGYSGLRYQYWAGFWRRSISVGLLRDIAKSALRIRDQLVDHQPIASTFFTDIGHA